MLADSNLQFWLDTQQQAAETQVVVYARSTRDTELGYHLEVVRHGRNGQSSVRQGGQRILVAGQALALSRLAINIQAGDDCRIELTTREGEAAPIVHRFDCPPPDRATAGESKQDS